MLDTYRELLRTLAGLLQLDPEELVRTQELACGELSVGLQYMGDGKVGDIAWFCDLGAPPPEQVAETWRLLLEANALWLGTGGATLGIQQGSDSILMSDRAPLGSVDAEGLAAALDNFVQVGRFWQQCLKDPRALVQAAVQA
jgi:hypothetical protein